MEKICPRCGALSSEIEFLGNFCSRCASSRVDIRTPASLEIKHCKHCDKILLNSWVSNTPHNLHGYILSKTKGVYSGATLASADSEKAELVFVVDIAGGVAELKKSVKLSFHPTTCELCSRKHGGYYEAILQIRGQSDKVEKWVKKMSRELSRKTFIVKYVEFKEGTDLFIGSREKLEETLAYYQLKSTKSAKLAGVKDGQRYYRVTYCVRV